MSTSAAEAGDAGDAALPTARVLTIAGSDSGGGAGIQADLRAMAAHGVHGMSAITAITAQNSVGVHGVHPVPLETIEAQFHAVVDDIGVDAIKTGMLGDAATVRLVARLLATVDVPVVVDPVCASKHGDPLLAGDAVQVIVSDLARHATVLTPNLAEAALLTGAAVTDPAQALADPLLDAGSRWVLIKGGHATGAPTDHLFTRPGATAQRWEFTGERHDNRHTHGTGCTLAATIASWLALDHAAGRAPDVPEAVRRAHDYVNGAIAHGFALGRGIGPVDHLWELRDRLPTR